MVTHEVTEPHQRLDEVVIQHYGDLTQFTAVKAANPHLINVFLSVGDVVQLPPRAVVKSEEVLW